MDIVTLAMAKAYTDGQRLAYVEPSKVLFSVDPRNINHDTPGIGLKAGEKYIVTLEGVDGYEGGTFEVVSVGEPGHVAIEIGDFYLVDYNKGWSIQFYPNDCSLATISTPETIVPIDPKYLPGVCLPVVELETVFDFESPPGGVLAEGDIQKLKAVTSPAFIGLFADANGVIRTMVFGAAGGTSAFMCGWHDLFLSLSIGIVLNPETGGYVMETY